MKTFKKFFGELLSAIYPNKCICCDNIIDNGKNMCNNCESNIERVNLDNICLDCGLEKSNCVCKYNIYRFNALISVFENNGLARKAYYSYKFGKKQFYSTFFADAMSDAIVKCYSDIEFDFVCYVPSYHKNKFNHSGYLAKRISNKLNIPLLDDMLNCTQKAKQQHKSSFKERLNNVEGKYTSNYRINDKVVLLVDDIKTTGATIDECTKILLFAGAKSVYCVTALSTVNNVEK